MKPTVLALLTALAIGCGSEPEGTVNIAFVSGSTTINTVTYAIKNSGGSTVNSGSISVSGNSANIKPSLSASVVPGTGYTATMTATTVAGAACSGTSAAFNIVAGQTTAVSMVLTCGANSNATQGNAEITATVASDSCPLISSWNVAPTTEGVGLTMTILGISASDSDVGDVLTTVWSAIGGLTGSFVGGTAAPSGFTCGASASSGQIQVSVSDNHVPSCTTLLTIDASCN